MKLLRYRNENSVRAGILDNDNKIRDISAIVEDWTSKTINDQNFI